MHLRQKHRKILVRRDSINVIWHSRTSGEVKEIDILPEISEKEASALAKIAKVKNDADSEQIRFAMIKNVRTLTAMLRRMHFNLIVRFFLNFSPR